jgi:CBS domain-containing protein
MLVRDIMSADPIFCAADTDLREVARMMVEFDCGEIPVCDERGRPIGVVTDRDMVCRMIALGQDPIGAPAARCMSRPVVTATPDMPIDDAARLMEQYQVRRLPVVDAEGACCGMLAQADLAIKGPRSQVVEVVEAVSEPALAMGA